MLLGSSWFDVPNYFFRVEASAFLATRDSHGERDARLDDARVSLPHERDARGAYTHNSNVPRADLQT